MLCCHLSMNRFCSVENLSLKHLSTVLLAFLWFILCFASPSNQFSFVYTFFTINMTLIFIRYMEPIYESDIWKALFEYHVSCKCCKGETTHLLNDIAINLIFFIINLRIFSLYFILEFLHIFSV